MVTSKRARGAAQVRAEQALRKAGQQVVVPRALTAAAGLLARPSVNSFTKQIVTSEGVYEAQ